MNLDDPLRLAARACLSYPFALRHFDDSVYVDALVALAALWDRFPRCPTAEAHLHTFQRRQNVAIDCAHFDGRPSPSLRWRMRQAGLGSL